MKNRKKVILRGDGWGYDYKLALTQEQINLLSWLLNEDLVSSEYDMQVLEEADEWVEV